MKKLLVILTCVGVFSISYAQKLSGKNDQVFACNDGCITGSSNIYVGSTATFTSTPTAQCTSCYDWDINGNATSSDNSIVGTVQIVGSDMGQTVSIKAISAGTFSINLTYFDETGCHTCCFTGTTSNPPPTCCLPILSGSYRCKGGPGTGRLYLNNDSNCPTDWSKISSVTVSTNAGTFTTVSGQVSSYTFSGSQLPLSGVVSTTGTCQPDVSFSVEYHFNNGCGTIVKDILFPNLNGPGAPATRSNSAGDEIIVSPNPTSSTIHFNGQNLNTYKVSIVSEQGVEIISNRTLETEINISNQPNGIYFYKITDANGIVKEGKILKQ